MSDKTSYRLLNGIHYKDTSTLIHDKYQSYLTLYNLIQREKKNAFLRYFYGVIILNYTNTNTNTNTNTLYINIKYTQFYF